MRNRHMVYLMGVVPTWRYTILNGLGLKCLADRSMEVNFPDANFLEKLWISVTLGTFGVRMSVR